VARPASSGAGHDLALAGPCQGPGTTGSGAKLWWVAEIRELERGVRLDESISADLQPEVESLCDLLRDAVADAVVSLALFEHAIFKEQEAIALSHTDRPASPEEWQRYVERSREEWWQHGERKARREEELAAQDPRGPTDPDYREWRRRIGEQAGRALQREEWSEEGGPEAYRRRLPFIHARSFVTALALLQRTLKLLAEYDLPQDVKEGVRRASEDFAQALPGLKGVRDASEHAEDRLRFRARRRVIDPAPVMKNGIRTAGGNLIVELLDGRNFGSTTESGAYAEVEVSDATTEVARATVQAVHDALPWQGRHRVFEPIH
jgi:hypothetical protein